MRDYFIVLPETTILRSVIPELKDLYLLVYSSNDEFLQSLGAFHIDDIHEDKHNFVINIDKIDPIRFPNIYHLRNNTEIGQQFLSKALFFIETDTRKGIDNRAQRVVPHRHHEPAVINFPLINCNEMSVVNFYRTEDVNDSTYSVYGVGYNSTGQYEPIASLSTRDGYPIILNSHQYHSVENHANARRIMAGWHMRDEITWEKVLAHFA